VRVVEVGDVTEPVVAAVARLVTQLSRSAPPLDRAGVARIVEHDATTLLVAEDEDGAILGTLTLAVFPIPSGVRAWIEDVVVDETARGRGVGEALSRRAVDIALAAGARTVELTSRPSREAANRLYLRLGFEVRETNVYRYTAEPDG
jgi:ribosomal protein S18 acetylase RimI-like enzyme